MSLLPNALLIWRVSNHLPLFLSTSGSHLLADCVKINCFQIQLLNISLLICCLLLIECFHHSPFFSPSTCGSHLLAAPPGCHFHHQRQEATKLWPTINKPPLGVFWPCQSSIKKSLGILRPCWTPDGLTCLWFSSKPPKPLGRGDAVTRNRMHTSTWYLPLQNSRFTN